MVITVAVSPVIRWAIWTRRCGVQRRALDREPQMAKAHFLRARARTALARKLPMDERKASFGDIVEVYTTALKQQENSKVLERLVLDGRAQTQLEFANYLSELSRVTKADESRSIRGYLEAARKDASAVLNSGPGKEHLSTFYQRLGNIEEDFAWLLDSDSKAQYEKAIANFDKALEAAGDYHGKERIALPPRAVLRETGPIP